MLSRQIHLEKLSQILLIVGGLNWAVTAYHLKQDDAVRDLVQTLFQQLAPGTDATRLRRVQTLVYIAVGVAAAYQAALMARAAPMGAALK